MTNIIKNENIKRTLQKRKAIAKIADDGIYFYSGKQLLYVYRIDIEE